MATALVVWDGNIRALEGRIKRDLAAAPPQRASQLHVELGVAYRVRGRIADALHEFDTAAALRPSASDLQVLRALTLEALGRTGTAGQAFRNAWMLDERNPVKAYYVAERSSSDGADRTRARDVLQNIYKTPSALNAGSAVPPFVTLDAIPDNLSNTPIVGDADTAGVFALLASGKFSEAVAALQRGGRATSGAGADNSSRGHLARGLSAEGENRVADARREYQAALAGALTGRSIIYVAIARLAQVDGDSAGAIDAFTRAAQLNPNNPTIHKEFAAAYSSDGRTDDAFRELIAAVVIDPRDGSTHAEIGQLLLTTGRALEAVDAFNRALELMPDRYETRYSLATAYSRLGNSAEAARQLEIFDRARRDALEKRRRELAVQDGR